MLVDETSAIRVSKRYIYELMERDIVLNFNRDFFLEEKKDIIINNELKVIAISRNKNNEITACLFTDKYHNIYGEIGRCSGLTLY